MSPKRNPNGAVQATDADRKLPPYLIVERGTPSWCCGCPAELGVVPTCECWCHDIARAFARNGTP